MSERRAEPDQRLRFPSGLDPVIASFLLSIAVSVVGLVLDASTRWLSGHVLLEVLLIGLSLVTVFACTAARWLARTSLQRVRATLSDRGPELEERRRPAQRLLRGLGQEVDLQLRGWLLSPTERETTLFLLKGCSHKEIASLTERSERTVGQHAVAVYRKSGLGRRAIDLVQSGAARAAPAREPSTDGV